MSSMSLLMQQVALFKKFLAGDIVRSKTLGLCIIPGKDLQAVLETSHGKLMNNEVRFICLRDGEVYTHLDNYVTQLYGRIQVKEY